LVYDDAQSGIGYEMIIGQDYATTLWDSMVTILEWHDHSKMKREDFPTLKIVNSRHEIRQLAAQLEEPKVT
jgi:hypothetical protein